jgi:hypothetical protein
MTTALLILLFLALIVSALVHRWDLIAMHARMDALGQMLAEHHAEQDAMRDVLSRTIQSRTSEFKEGGGREQLRARLRERGKLH